MKTTETSVRTAGLQAVIRTRNLSNTEEYKPLGCDVMSEACPGFPRHKSEYFFLAPSFQTACYVTMHEQFTGTLTAH
jgi:hypothetical protein